MGSGSAIPLPVVVAAADLPPLEGAHGAIPGRHLLEGARFGLAHLTLVLGETAPGGEARLHRHDCEELSIAHARRGTSTVGETVVEGGPGDAVLIPSGVPHRYANRAQEPLRHTAVHATVTFVLVHPAWHGDRAVRTQPR